MGGVCSLARLREGGVTARQAATAVQRGQLIRLRNGWFAVPGADEELCAAVRLGGQLTSSSRLSRLGLWTMPDARLHVSVASDATRLRSPLDRRVAFRASDHPLVCVHWQTLSWDPLPSEPLDSLKSSIARLILCHDLDSAIVTIDSALNTKSGSRRVLEEFELAAILAALPAKYAHIGELVEPLSQSGLETLARLRLRRRGLRVRAQVSIANVGSVDLLIGERLVLELDSRAHHLGKNYEKDRARDLELFRQGFTVIRVSYQRAMYDWDSVETAILDAVRRGEHQRRAVHRRLGLALS
jgi:very-short-patch-repair endonuclease